jgi:hypothetical protein
MSKIKLKYYIKERNNPQTGTYYVAEGLLTKKAAKAQEVTLYGQNIMRPYDTKEEYEAAISELEKRGEKVHV